MTDTFDPTAALRDAQRRAYDHAQAAQQHHEQDSARLTAQSRAERARLLADTWSHVATALAAGPDRQAATFDVNVQVDPKDVDRAARQVAQLRRPLDTDRP